MQNTFRKKNTLFEAWGFYFSSTPTDYNQNPGLTHGKLQSLPNERVVKQSPRLKQ